MYSLGKRVYCQLFLSINMMFAGSAIDCNMSMESDVRGLVTQLDAATKQLSSIAGLKRLAAHDEVKEFWMKGEAIMANVKWQAQNDALAGISQLTRTYTALQFIDFRSSIPRLIKMAIKAKENANTSSQSLAKAARNFADLSHEVDGAVKTLSTKGDHHEYWQARDADAVKNYGIAGHVLGPLTFGLGYTLWIAGDEYQRRADNHTQSLQIIKDVRGILKNKVGPVFKEASEAMDAAASFFDRLAIKLQQVQSMGAEQATAPASELHLHYEEMREVMKELRDAVETLSACVRKEDRRIENS